MQMINIKQLYNSPDLPASIEKVFQYYDAKQAVAYGNDKYTYSVLFSDYQKTIEWLTNVPTKQLVLVKIKNSYNSLSILLGCIVADFIPLFCDPVWTHTEIIETAQRHSVDYILTDDELINNKGDFIILSSYHEFKLYNLNLNHIKTEIHLLPETAFCRFTSGSTGFSRCLQFSWQAYLNANYSWWDAIQLNQNDRVLCLATLNNGLAFNTSILTTLFAGGMLIFHKGFIIPSNLQKTILLHHPTVLVAFPFVYNILKNDKVLNKDSCSLRIAVSSASKLDEESDTIWEDKFGFRICNYYGAAEVGPCTFNNGSEIGSLGKPLLGVEILIDENENNRIKIKTNSISLGFLDQTQPYFYEKLDANGYYLTSDSGHFSENNNLYIDGRIDKIINIEGRKIDPVEVEKMIKTLEDISNVIVLKYDSENRSLLAAIIESSSNNLNPEEIRKFCAKHLAPYKIPQKIKIVEKLPLSENGKVPYIKYIQILEN